MSLSFLHAGIAGLGLLAAAVPIVIHLLLRERPRPIVFPAMELIRARHTTLVRRLKIRHWILLALRVALLLLLALVLARPTLHSRFFSIDQSAPVSAILVFDTSLSMQYKEQGESRLSAARRAASTVAAELPDNSDVTIVTSATPTLFAPLDVPAALSNIEDVELSPVTRPLNDALAVAYKGLAKSNKQRREIYLFTDLAAHAWDQTSDGNLEELARLAGEGVRVYVINLGIAEPTNISVLPLELGQQVLPAESALELAVRVRNVGPAVDRAIEVEIDDQPRASRPVQLATGQAPKLSFAVPGLGVGVHSGRVLVRAGDPMPFDDVRYFTVDVQPAIRILVVADEPLDTINWVNALSPEVRRDARAPYAIDTVTDWDRFETTALENFQIVCLLNVGTPSRSDWLRLLDFVRAGGGVLVALGDRVDPVSYNSEPAQALLPGKLASDTRQGDGVVLSPERYTHPVLARFRDFDSDLADRPVLRYWKIEPAEGSVVVLPYTPTGDPGLIERTFGPNGTGRVLLLTTAAHYRPSADTWSELPLGWSYLVLADQIVRYLGGLTDRSLNHVAGRPVTIALDARAPFSLFSITGPDDVIERVSVDPGEGALTIPATHQLGHYRVDAALGSRQFADQFSVNAPARESRLEPIEEAKLIALIGEDRVAIARDPAELPAIVGEARVGKELVPWLFALLLVVFAAESYIANRFYRKPAGES